MKTIYLTEEQLTNLNEVASKMLYEENDPRSMYYNRILNRPRIHWLRIFLFLFFPIPISVLSILILSKWHITGRKSIFITSLFLLLYIITFSKKAVVCAIRIYQRYAPASLRKKCRFEPSCSQYMILAIEKYGLQKGLLMGIDRLKRCNVNNGGFDEP